VIASRSARDRARHLGPERRRPQVLDVALDIAAEGGIADVTMAAISQRMGVSRPVVYDCYPSRGDVLAALMDRESQAALSSLLAILPPLRTGSVEQMFVDGFHSLLDNVVARPASWRIIFANDPDPILVQAISRGRTRITEQVATVLRPLLEKWQVADIDRVLPVHTEVFVGICDSAVRLMLADGGAWTPADLADVVGRSAYRAVRAVS
jgi:AcrR family transcriptional regulator